MISYTETIKKWAGTGKEEFLRAALLAFTKFYPSSCNTDVVFTDNRKIEWYINNSRHFSHRWSSYDNNPDTCASFLTDMLIQGNTMKNNDTFIITITVIETN